MPAAAQYIPDMNDPANKPLDEAFKAEMDSRRTAHKAAWAYYDGEHKAHLKPDASQTDDNVTINKLDQVVDKAVSELVGRDDKGNVIGARFDVADRPGDTGFSGRLRRAARTLAQQEPPEQVYLDQVWSTNERQVFQHAMAMNGAVCGHCFVEIVPDGQIDYATGETVARLVNLDPSSVGVFWDAGDVERVLWYRKEFGTDKAKTRIDVVREVDETGTDRGQWSVVRWQQQDGLWRRQGEPRVWPWPWAPIIDWQNLPRPNLYYGRSDIGRTGRLNDSLNFTASNLQRILKYHAHPKMVGVGFSAKQIEKTAINDFWAIPNPEAKLMQIEMLNDLSSSMAYIQLLVRSIFDSARELDPQSVQDKLGDLTNFALRVLYGDTLGKLGTKRMVYGAALTKINRALLALGGYSAATRINSTWPDPLPVNQMEEAQALDIDRRHGASQTSYLERRGYDPIQEEERRLEEGQTAQEALAGMLTNIQQGGGGLF